MVFCIAPLTSRTFPRTQHGFLDVGIVVSGFGAIGTASISYDDSFYALPGDELGEKAFLGWAQPRPAGMVILAKARFRRHR